MNKDLDYKKGISGAPGLPESSPSSPWGDGEAGPDRAVCVGVGPPNVPPIDLVQARHQPSHLSPHKLLCADLRHAALAQFCPALSSGKEQRLETEGPHPTQESSLASIATAGQMGPTSTPHGKVGEPGLPAACVLSLVRGLQG